MPGAVAIRLKDQQSMYFGTSRNPCDFLCYRYPLLCMIECKTHEGNTLNFSDFPQYNLLTTYQGVKGLKAGTVIWFYDHDEIVYVPIQTWDKLKKEGKKSFNRKYIGGDDYPNILIPSEKLVVYLRADYSSLYDTLKEDEDGGNISK